MRHFNTYTNTADDGRNGRNFEVDLRAYLKGIFERCHHMDVTDISVKRGVTLEVKSGCGWLVSPFTDDICEADDLLENGFKMKRATYIAYLPQYTEDTDISEVRFFTQAQFLRIFSEFNKVRVKRSSAGLYGLAIQSYIPSEKFRASKKVYAEILSALECGLTAEEFVDKFGLVA